MAENSSAAKASSVANLKKKLGSIPIGLPGVAPPVFGVKSAASPPRKTSGDAPDNAGSNTMRRRVRGPKLKRRPSKKQRVYYTESISGDSEAFKVTRVGIGANAIKREIIEKVDPHGSIDDYYLVAVDEKGVRRPIKDGENSNLAATERLTLRKRRHSEIVDERDQVPVSRMCAKKNPGEHDDKVRREDTSFEHDLLDDSREASDGGSTEPVTPGEDTESEPRAIRKILEEQMLKILDHPLLTQADPDEGGASAEHDATSDADLSLLVGEVKREMGLDEAEASANRCNQIHAGEADKAVGGGDGGIPVFTPSPQTLAEMAALEQRTHERSQTDDVNKRLLGMAMMSIPQSKFDRINACAPAEDHGSHGVAWELGEEKIGRSTSDAASESSCCGGGAPARDNAASIAHAHAAVYALAEGLSCAMAGEAAMAMQTGSESSHTNNAQTSNGGDSRTEPARASKAASVPTRSAKTTPVVVDAVPVWHDGDAAAHGASEFSSITGHNIIADGQEALANASTPKVEPVDTEYVSVTATDTDRGIESLVDTFVKVPVPGPNKEQVTATSNKEQVTATANKEQVTATNKEQVTEATLSIGESKDTQKKEADPKLSALLEPKPLPQGARKKKHAKGESWIKNKTGLDMCVLV